MKRMYFVSALVLGLALVVAPLSFSLSVRGVNVESAMVLAASQPQPTKGGGSTGANLTTPGKCPSGQQGVGIALPLLNASETCIPNNAATGGAIVYYLRELLQLLGGVIGTVIVMMLVLAGIQYITSAGNSSNIKAAKDRITNAMTALILFMFMVAILQFLVPGGIL